jgi:hypothetical protein
MATMAMTHENHKSFDISYGIYTIERLPKGSKRSPRWDLHSTAKDRNTAENHAKTLSAQPYFDRIEVQEFRICAQTKERSVQKIKSYSRKSQATFFIIVGIFALIAILFLFA